MDIDEDDIFPGAAKDMGSGQLIREIKNDPIHIIPYFRGKNSFSQSTSSCHARRTRTNAYRMR